MMYRSLYVLPKDTHYYVYLDEKEKRYMFDTCRTVEKYNEYLYKRLVASGKVIGSVIGSIQMKDQAGNWMNVFKVFYKL